MQYDWILFYFLAGLLGAYFFLYRKWKSPPPALPVSKSQLFFQKKNIKLWLAASPERLYWLAALLILFAISNPQIDISSAAKILGKKEVPRKGIALYFLLDQSGSMEEKVSVVDALSDIVQVRKIDMAKRVISQFIDGRENDLIGLISFARTANVLSPLTLDRQKVKEKLLSVEPMTEDRLNGTAIGYAIFKTVNMIVATKYFSQRNSQFNKPVYSIDNQAIIIVTDGLQSPHPDDKNHAFRFTPPEEAINYAKESGIRVYFIGVDPVFEKDEFAAEVSRLKEDVNSTGGAFFLATKALPIEEIFAKIDTMEKSEFQPELVQGKGLKRSFVPDVLWMAIAVLLLGILGETVFLRKVP